MRPTDRRVARWILIAAAWTLFALFIATQNFASSRYGSLTQPLSWGSAVQIALAEWYAWALLVPLVIWLARRVPFERRTWWRAAPVHAVAAIVVAIGKMMADQIVLGLLGWPQPGRFVVLRLHANLITYGVVVALAHGAAYYTRYRERMARAASLESALAKAELQVLKMQLQPHFLFNTLNAIAELMHEDVETAEQMVVHLSELLRLAIDHGSSEQVRLEQELEFLDRYLAIQRLRFGDKLQVTMAIDPASLDVRVPSLILQPIVENAIRHGIAPRAGGGRVHVAAQRHGAALSIEVHDDGRGPDEGVATGEGAPRNGGGVGLANTRARLARLYGDGSALELSRRVEGGAVVRLSIPIA